MGDFAVVEGQLVLVDSSGTELKGQKTMAASLPVVIASDQPAIPVSSSPASSTPGISVGTVATSATTNVPVRATTYTEPASNAQRSIASASANDTSAGTGARQVKITYLDSTGAGPYTETVTLNGTSAVNTAASNICFIEKLEVVSVGSGGANAGVITLYSTTGGGGSAVGTIAASANRTLWAHHYVPTSKTCNVTSIEGNNNNASNGAIVTLQAKTLGVATAPDLIVSDYVRIGGGTPNTVRTYGTPIKVTGPARLLLYAAPEGTPTITHRAAFDYFDA